MGKEEENQLMEELELAKMMVKDLEKLWKSYAKKALAARQERELKQIKKGFLKCETREELIESYGYAEIDEDAYRRGLEYFDNPEKPKLSVTELHRKNIRELLDRWKGTAYVLEEELNPKPPAEDKEDAFEKMNRLEREERYRNKL